MTPLDEFPETLEDFVTRASETANLPSSLGAPHSQESLGDLQERLLVTRSAMTSLSGLLGQAVLFQGRVEATLIEARGVLGEAEAGVVSSRAAKPSFGEDFSSAKEKNARLGAETLEEARKVRQIERLFAQVKAVTLYLRDRHRELDRAVRDVETRVKVVLWEDNHM